MIKNKSIDYIFRMITGALLVFTISCNQPQTKTVDEKVEEMKNIASKAVEQSKVVEKPKIVEESKIYKTTAYDSRLLPNPNSN